jgi:DNA-binding MarR family transcriptional regulator
MHNNKHQMGHDKGFGLGSPAERFTRRMFARIVTSVARTLREHELSVAQLAALYLIDDRGTMRVGDVAAELVRSAPAASRMVDDLVRQGLVAREEDPTDRRARVLALTPAGHEFVALSSEARVKTMAEVAREMPAGAFRTLARIARPGR